MDKNMPDQKKLLLSDLPPRLRSYAEIIGLEKLIELARQEGGKSLYIPTEECLNKYGLKRQIHNAYNGKNIRELEEKYGLSKTTIYEYIKE